MRGRDETGGVGQNPRLKKAFSDAESKSIETGEHLVHAKGIWPRCWQQFLSKHTCRESKAWPHSKAAAKVPESLSRLTPLQSKGKIATA